MVIDAIKCAYFLFYETKNIFFYSALTKLLAIDTTPSTCVTLHYLHTANVYRELRGTCRENLQYLWKRAVRITKKPYTPQRERLRILWRNPVIFTDCGETPALFHRYCRFSLHVPRNSL